MTGDLYEVELWWRGKVLLGNIRHLCRNLKWEKTLNGVYGIDFTLDALAFERWCEMINHHPRSVLEPLNTDVRIKRNGIYIIGGNVVQAGASSDDNKLTIEVVADGFLNLLERYITGSYNQVSAEDIAVSLIERTQSEKGDLGITIGNIERKTQLRDRNYEDVYIKDAIVRLTRLVTPTYDFEFAPDRTFNLYASLGSTREDVVLEYPGTAVASYTSVAGELTLPCRQYNPRLSGENLYNRIIAKGEGTGQATLRDESIEDTESQSKYFLRERLSIQSSVKELPTLQQNALGELEMYSRLEDMPEVVLDGTAWFGAGLGIGDRVRARQSFYKMYPLDGFYRISQVSCTVSDGDDEEVTVTLDDILINKVSGDIEEQD